MLQTSGAVAGAYAGGSVASRCHTKCLLRSTPPDEPHGHLTPWRISASLLHPIIQTLVFPTIQLRFGPSLRTAERESSSLRPRPRCYSRVDQRSPSLAVLRRFQLANVRLRTPPHDPQFSPSVGNEAHVRLRTIETRHIWRRPQMAWCPECADLVATPRPCFVFSVFKECFLRPGHIPSVQYVKARCMVSYPSCV
jgi:hypothetical protein